MAWKQAGLLTLCLARFALDLPPLRNARCNAWLQPLLSAELPWTVFLAMRWPLFGWAYAAQVHMSVKRSLALHDMQSQNTVCDSWSTDKDVEAQADFRTFLM